MSYEITNGIVKCPTLVDGFISEKCGFLKLVARLLSFEQWILFAPFSSKVREWHTLVCSRTEQMYIWLELIYWIGRVGNLD